MKKNLFTTMSKKVLVILALVLGIIFPGKVVLANERTDYEKCEVKQFFKIDDKVYEYYLLYVDGKVSAVEVAVSKETEEVAYDLDKITMVSPEIDLTIKEIQDLLVARKEITKESLTVADRNNDGVISIIDLISGLNVYYCNPTNFLIVDGKTMELSNFIELVNYYESKGQKSFIIRNNEKVPEVTTTSETSTTRLTTTTPENTTIMTTFVTTTTPKATTVTTVTTPKATTTVTTTTTPKATTVTTTTTPKVTTVTTITTPKVTTVTTTTTPKATTVTTTTTPKATTVTTTTTVATTPTSKETPVIPPEVPLDPDGWEMEQNLYEGYLQTAELYGIKNYKLVWTEEEIPYSIIIANDGFCSFFELSGYMGVQLCPISDLETIVPGYFDVPGMENCTYDVVVWRPYSKDDTINDKFPVRFEHFILNKCVSWEYEHWCLIPLDENGNEILKFLYPIKK